MKNQNEKTTLPSDSTIKKAIQPQPIAAQREISVGKLHINITSIFAGERNISEKLFAIANRRLNGSVSFKKLICMILIAVALLAILIIIALSVY